MPRKSKYTDEQLVLLVPKALSYTGVCRLLGISIHGGNGTTVKRRIERLGLNTDHFTGQGWNKGRTRPPKILDIATVLCANSPYSSGNNLKKRLIKTGILVPVCAECGLGELWQGKPISLHMDHTNGVKTDNRIENLRILCPNCHSQTHTYAGKNRAYLRHEPLPLPYIAVSSVVNKARQRTVRLCVCGSEMSRIAIRCSRCASTYASKAKWPSDEELKRLVWEKPTVHVAKDLGVSDKAVDNRCRRRGIIKPARGYWEKIYHGDMAERQTQTA